MSTEANRPSSDRDRVPPTTTGTPSTSGTPAPTGVPSTAGTRFTTAPTTTTGTPSASGSPSKKDVAAQEGKAQAHQLKDEAADSGQRVKETAKGQARAVKDEATHQAHDLLERLKGDAQEYVGPQQERLASTVRSVSDELHALANGEQPESHYVTGLLGNAAGRARTLADSLEHKDPQQLLQDVRRFAARRPGTFLAIAAGIGLLAGRATRGARDSEDVATDSSGVKEYFGGDRDTGQGTGTTGTTHAAHRQDDVPNRDTTASDPYAYRPEEQQQQEPVRTYTDRVPGTIYPDQEGRR